MLDAFLNKYGSVALVVIGSGLSIMALRAVKRWVFWLLLLIAIPCLLIAGAFYWYSLHGGIGSPAGRFQSSIRVGMTGSEVWEAVEEHYAKGDPHRPTVLQNGTERVSIYMPGDGQGSPQKTIQVRFENGRVVEVSGK